MGMSIAGLDVVDELRLRRWARENFVPAEERDATWHAVVLNEMSRKDAELHEAADSDAAGRAYVPLHPGGFLTLHGPHIETSKSATLFKVPELANLRNP